MTKGILSSLSRKVCQRRAWKPVKNNKYLKKYYCIDSCSKYPLFVIIDLPKLTGHEDTSTKVSQLRETQSETNLISFILDILFLFFQQQLKCSYLNKQVAKTKFNTIRFLK